MKRLPPAVLACPICHPEHYDNAPLQVTQCDRCGYGQAPEGPFSPVEFSPPPRNFHRVQNMNAAAIAEGTE